MPDAPGRALPFANPRPGVVKTLGVCNIVFAIFGSLLILTSAFYTYAAANMSRVKASVDVKVQVPAVIPTRTGGQAGMPMIAGFDPFMGMDDPGMIRFNVVDCVVGGLANALMFATGIALLNLKPWGARWWWHLAWAKIALAFLFWGYFIVALAPTLSESMGKSVSAMMASQPGLRPGQAPPAALLTWVYSVMCLIVGLGMIVVSSIYPAISLWMLSRPGVRAVFAPSPPFLEPRHP